MWDGCWVVQCRLTFWEAVVPPLVSFHFLVVFFLVVLAFVLSWHPVASSCPGACQRRLWGVGAVPRLSWDPGVHFILFWRGFGGASDEARICETYLRPRRWLHRLGPRYIPLHESPSAPP